MTINDGNSQFKEPQRRFQRHRRSRKSPAQPSASQAQVTSDTQSGSEENIGALFDSATNTLITGGQFTAGGSVNRTVTINIGGQTEGITPQAQTENYHSRQATNRSRNRRRGQMRPQQDPTGPVQRSNEIYERHLRQKKRGHPLYIPQSNMVLPIPYRAQGVRVGDVGIFTEDGAFDFLFNICVSRDDPINPVELPENFLPIPSISPTDIRKFAQFSPGSYLASSSVAECRTTEQSSGLTFESSASEGAILTMPEGAYSEDLSNSSRLRQYIATHAEDWYKFVNGPRGREAQNGGLHVVAGCDKTTSWGMATFANSSLSQDTNFRLKFSASGEQPSHRNPGNTYTWEHSGVAEVRVGPGRGENEELGETDSNRLRNQCLFVRTLNVTLSEKVWGEIFPQTVAVPDQNDAHPGIQNQSTNFPHGSRTGHSYSQSSRSNSSQNLPFRGHTSAASSTTDFIMKPPNPMGLPSLNSSSYDIVDGLPTFPLMSLHKEIKPSFGSGPFIDDFTDEFRQDVIGSTSRMKSVVLPSQLAAEEETSSQISSSISPNFSGYEVFQCDSVPTPDVILTPSSSCNRVLHPSKIINQYLLEQVPHARVAVTNDRDWSGIIGMDSCYSDPAHLLSVVLSMNDIVLEDDTGLVFLELKERGPNSTLSEESRIAGLAESIRHGRLTLEEYLFGAHGDRRRHLQDLCDALRSGSTNQPIPILTGHPERPLSLDEICNENFDMKDSTQRQSIVSLQAELSSLSLQPADRSSCLLRLADALSRRFSQWHQRDDLEEAIWCYEEALSQIPKFHYQYLETLLGLSSALYQRFYLLGHADDLKNVLGYLELQYEVLEQGHSLLVPVEARLKKLRTVCFPTTPHTMPPSRSLKMNTSDSECERQASEPTRPRRSSKPKGPPKHRKIPKFLAQCGVPLLHYGVKLADIQTAIPSVSVSEGTDSQDTPPWPTTPHMHGSPIPNLRRALTPVPPTPDEGPSPRLYGKEPQIYGQPEAGLISPRDTVGQNGVKYEKAEPYLRVRINGLDRNRRDILVKLDAQTNLSNFNGTTYRNVSRSYLEFQQFYESIVHSNPQTIVPALPLAQTSAPTDEEDDWLVVIMLQRWITRVCEDPILLYDEDVRSFIESDFGYQPTPRPKRKATSG